MTSASRRRPASAGSAIELAEHAVGLVRAAGWGTLALYHLGAMPFVALFVLYFEDMSIMAYEPVRLVAGALLLGLFFQWMKVWQAVYACRLWDRLQNRPDGEPRHWLRLAARQAFLQPFGLAVLPVALLALLPYGAAHAYYQNLTVLDRGRDMKVGELSREARHHALEQPRQAFLLIWALSPSAMIFIAALVFLVTPLLDSLFPEGIMLLAGLLEGILLVLFFPLSPLPVIIAANVFAALLVGPLLLQTLLGVSTPLIEVGGIWGESLSIITMTGIVYLLLDPLVKAAFVLRCFRCEAERSGEDLRSALRRIRSIAPMAALMAGFAAALLSGGAADAQQKEAPAPPVMAAPAGELDGHIDSVLRNRAYAWRIPGEKDFPKLGAVGAFIEGVGQTIAEWFNWFAELRQRLARWLERWIYGSRRGGEGGRISTFQVDLTLLVLLALLTAMAVFLYWRHRRARQTEVPVAAQPAVMAQPDIADENTLATDLPDDEWVRMAARLAAEGDHRGAIRAAFLSLLAWLAAQDFLRVARAKSNRDYGNELERRAHARPECLAAFRLGVTVFEPAWYGNHPATADQVGRVINLGERLRRGEPIE